MSSHDKQPADACYCDHRCGKESFPERAEKTASSIKFHGGSFITGYTGEIVKQVDCSWFHLHESKQLRRRAVEIGGFCAPSRSVTKSAIQSAAHAPNAGLTCAQLGKDTDDPYPTLQPKDEEGIVIAEFNLDEIAEARHRCVYIGRTLQPCISHLEGVSDCTYRKPGETLLAAAGDYSETGGQTYMAHS